LKRALAYVKRYGTSAVLVYLDLDGFKSVNDRHGHAAGDAVLKAVAMVLTRQVRACDLVGRLVVTNSSCCCGIWPRRMRKPRRARWRPRSAA